MKLDFLNVDEFCEDLLEITTTKIYSKHGFHPEGLFSQKIFGPEKTATCGCGIYWGRGRIGDICNTCGVDITYSGIRRKRFAKICLPFQVMNPIMYHLIVRAGKNTMRDMMENLLYNDKIYGYYYDKQQKRFIAVNAIFKEKESDEEQIPTLPEGCTWYRGVKGIEDIVIKQCEDNKDKDKNWKFISDNFSKFYMSNIIVLPPEFRPVSKSKDAQQRAELNQYYITILNFSVLMKDDNIEIPMIRGIGEISFRNLQRHIFGLYNYIFGKLSKKTGLIRGSILGKRVDFSGRAVISPDPTLKIEECSIPYIMILELFKLEIANVLLETRQFKRYDSAIDHIEDCIRLEDLSLLDIATEVCDGEYVILNRQPTLHRMGVLSFKIIINIDYVIKIHPMVCDPYNADFDGDQMAIYRSLSPETNNESRQLLSIKNNLLSPTTGGMVVGINQDILLGLYLLTQEDNKNQIIDPIHSIPTYKGRLIFMNCLPDSYKNTKEKFILMNRQIDKKFLRVIIDDLCRVLPVDEVVEVLDNIKELGFKYTTMHGCTMSLKNLKLESATDLASDIFDNDKLTWMEKFEKLQSKEVHDIVKESYPYSDFIESGSRGSWDQANQIILSRGFISNFDGEIIKEPIRNNLLSGLTRKEFFNSCYGARKGLLNTALNTGESGYLTRKLVYAGVNLELDLNVNDCGCKETLNLIVPEGKEGIKFAKILIGRYIVEHENGKSKLKLINYENYHTIVDQGISLRSPIFCKNPRICKTCYGETADKILHSKYIGIIAAEALGEVSTQLVLRTFHTSGAATKSKNNEGQQDIVNDLTIVKRILHGNSGCSYDQAVLALYDVYSQYKNILMVHYECIVSQMMRSGNMRWRLTSDRDITKYDLISIESVPSKESWLLGLAFSKPKAYLIDGILDEGSSASGILERIMTNERDAL